jgi:beta-N-acetylhexosaminidase
MKDLKDLIGLHFFIGIRGPELSSMERAWFSRYGAGGVVFFSRNIQNPEQLHYLMKEIRALCCLSPALEPPLFCIDMEGGRISELKGPGFPQWLAPSHWQKDHPDKTLYEFGLSMGIYLKQLGFHVNFAPCLDVLTQWDNDLMKGRTLGFSSEEVVTQGALLLRGYHDSGLLTTAKHFPGHGHTVADSHFELPVDSRSLEELEAQSLAPFSMASQEGSTFVMTAHVIYPEVDSVFPATLSSVWLKDILRNKLGITSFCLADDLDMQALRAFGKPEDIALRFLQAGGDFLMYCHRLEPPFEILEVVQSRLEQDPGSWQIHLAQARQSLSRIKLGL